MTMTFFISLPIFIIFSILLLRTIFKKGDERHEFIKHKALKITFIGLACYLALMVTIQFSIMFILKFLNVDFNGPFSGVMPMPISIYTQLNSVSSTILFIALTYWISTYILKKKFK